MATGRVFRGAHPTQPLMGQVWKDANWEWIGDGIIKWNLSRVWDGVRFNLSRPNINFQF